MKNIIFVVIFIGGTVAVDDPEIEDGLVASQSSTAFKSESQYNEAIRAIDGNFDTDLRRGFCSLTENEGFNWWMLDLGNVFSVSTVRIYNRADCCRDDLINAVIHISFDSSFNTNTQCGTAYTQTDVYNGPMIDRTCDGTMGRYIRISNTGLPVQLCEVQVFGTELDTCSNGNDCDVSNGHCVNNATDYYCGCNTGYYLQDDGRTCIADPCANSSLNNCDDEHGSCTTLATGYKCGCDTNYNLQQDGHTCVVDFCSNSTLNNCDKEYGICTPNGAGYKCACLEGYILQTDGVTCTDFDICANSTLHNCDEELGFCVNNGTGYYCGCYLPYHIHSDGFRCIARPQSKAFELVSGGHACLRGELNQFTAPSLLYCANACLRVTACNGYHYHTGGVCVFGDGTSDGSETCYSTGRTYIIPT